MRVGTEWLVDAAGCAPEALRDAALLEEICEEILHDLELRTVGQGHWHTFRGPGGVTGIYLLTESHLTCHTYPEHGIATFNLYCCRRRPRWEWEARLQSRLKAATVQIRQVSRGEPAACEPAFLLPAGEHAESEDA